MSKLSAIIRGWYYYLTADKKSRELSKSRTAICNNCQHRYKPLNICNSCGCFLPAKTRVEDAQCPNEYWWGMANFIILQSTLIEYNKNIEDIELQELSAYDLGDCKVLINVSQIMMVIENQGSTLITLTNLDRLVSNNSIDEVIQKINASQVMASIQ